MEDSIPVFSGPQITDSTIDQYSQDIEINSGLYQIEKLKARLYSYAPVKAEKKSNVLCFKGITKSQARRLYAPVGPKLEPLVGCCRMFSH